MEVLNLEEKLPAAIKKVWAITALLNLFWWVILAAAIIAAHQFWNWSLLWLYLPLALAIIQPTGQLLLIRYRYAFWRYRITADAIYMKKGAIFQKQEAVPITRVQNVTLEAGPILRHFQLQAVKIETASTSHDIDGVTVQVAGQLRDQIMRLAQEAKDEA